MSSRTASPHALLALFALLAVPLGAQDWESFAASSSRSMDPAILQIMARSDLEQNIAICKGLGRRADADRGALAAADAGGVEREAVRVPACFWDSAMACSARVVFPEDSGP